MAVRFQRGRAVPSANNEVRRENMAEAVSKYHSQLSYWVNASDILTTPEREQLSMAIKSLRGLMDSLPR
jgi:hypothetical protein